MNSKEKWLFGSLVGLVALGVGYAIVNSLFLRPASDARASIEKNTKDYEQAKAQVDRGVVLAKKLEQLLARTYTGRFENDSSDTQRLSGMRLRMLALKAGLNADTLDLRATTGRSSSSQGDFLQVGWTISARGKLANVVDFLHMVQSQDYIQRIDNLKLTSDLSSLQVMVNFNYYTVAIMPQNKTQRAAADKPLVDSELPDAGIADLSEPARARFNGLVARDLFRPYVKKKVIPKPPVEVEKPPVKIPKAPVEPPKRVSTDRYFSVVGLPNFSSDPASASILIRDTRDGSVKEYRSGDELADGTIVMVDYRPMASHTEPSLSSFSRVIIKRTDGYYAIDLGELLAAAHKLEPEQLPESLKAAEDGNSTQDADTKEVESKAVNEPDEKSSDSEAPLHRPAVIAPDAFGIPDEVRHQTSETNGDSGG